MNNNHCMIWPVLSYRDAPAAISFLTKAFGFEETASYCRGDDPSIVEHAELRTPLGGGVMFGTAGKDDSPFGQRAPGTDSVYVVCDDPDALFTQAVAAGAEVVRELKDEDYGSRGFTVRDPEGNLWSFGTYRGEDATTPPPDDSRGQFAQLMRDSSAAIVANDPERINQFVTPDWALVGPRCESMSRDQFLVAVASGDLTHDTMTHDVLRVEVLGDIAVITSRGRNTGAWRGEPMEADEWTIDVFVRRGDRWLCTQTCLTPVAVTTD